MKKKDNKTKKIKKKRLKISGILFIAIILFGFYYLTSNLIKIKATNINIKGNKYLKDSIIIKNAHLENNISYIKANNKICKKIKKNPLIKTCKIKHNLDLSLTIKVEENKPLFYYLDKKKIALSNGKFVKTQNTFGVPTLINKVPKTTLNKFISSLSNIDSDIISNISEIEYSPSLNSEGKPIDNNRFILIMNDTNSIYINIKHINVLNYYTKIYASIKDKRGTYYFDCDYNNYYFEEYIK